MINTKITKIFMFLGAASLVLSSCEDQLEITPQDQLTQEVSFSNETTTRGVLTGVYSAAQQDDVLNGTLQLMTEWQADNVNFVGSFPTFQDVRDYTTLSDNGSIFSIWDDNYETIGGANLVIANTMDVDDPGFSDDEKNEVIAEAKFMRALIYFNITNVFGHAVQVSGGTNLAVPLQLTPFKDGVVEFPSRATVNEVHNQIEQDLTEAIPFLSNGDNSRANKAAAQALLARLYLYQGKWDEAANLANQAIATSNVSLAADYSFYNTLNNELIFTLVNTAADGQDSNEGFSGLTNPANLGGRGDVEYSQNLIAAFNAEPGDKRFSELTLVQGGVTYTSKFPDGNNSSDNAPVLRATEMYLTRAEANLRAGSNVGDTPLNDINALRARAGLADLTSVTVDNILTERRKELCFEGLRRMDLLRNNENLRRAGMNNVAESAPGQNKTIFPIPVREVDLNDNLQQNDGY